MKVIRKIIQIDEDLCDGCGQCIPACVEEALQIIDGKAKLISEKYCDGLGACLGECPKGAITISECKVEEFDEEAAEKYVHSKNDKKEPMACECSSSQIQSFPSAGLTHWPVQIMLIPESAPFLKDAHLLVAADCTLAACSNFHKNFLTHRVLMIGCPKFDDVQAYIQKFTQIFNRASIKDIKIVIMEVPCCQGLPAIIKKAMSLANKSIAFEIVVIDTKGNIQKR